MKLIVNAPGICRDLLMCGDSFKPIQFSRKKPEPEAESWTEATTCGSPKKSNQSDPKFELWMEFRNK